MALIVERRTNDIMGSEVLLLEPTKGEYDFGGDRYVRLEVDSFKDCSFDEMRELGTWLINQANELQKL